MPTPILPYDEWQAGTLQNSVPANTNALRSEALAANVISDATTAQPASPTDGDCYIIPAGATGAQWATFAEGSLALFRAGTWYEFTAYEGLLKVVAGEVKIYNGSAWAVYGGGGGGSSSISVEENGVLVAADVTTINFTGSGANLTDAGGGQVDCEIPAGGGGGGGSFNPIAPTTPVRRSGSRKLLYDLQQPSGTIGTNNVQADTYICAPFSVGRTINVTALGIWLGSSGTGAVRLGIYDNTFSGGSDLPGSRLVQTADIDTSGSSSTFRTGSATVTLEPGNIYWLMLVKRGSASIGILAGDRPVMGRAADISNSIITALTASASGWTEIPATAPALTQQTSAGFRIAGFFEE